ncbi:pyruvate kinase [Candidatus Woesearchaeota archaeon]|nr:pyruvate kinase [Candidatus Woesearchaeota archaeon]
MNNLQAVFEFLYKNQEDRHNINQLAKLVNISVGSAFKILKNLKNGNYVEVIYEKNSTYYKIKLSDKSREFYYQIMMDINQGEKKKTKIVGTIGPASNNPKIVRRLIDNGLDCIRINASHCDENSALQLINTIRKTSSEIPIILDIPGPKIRLNNLSKSLEIKSGDIIKFKFKKSGDDSLLLDTPLHKFVSKGHRILVDDGKIELRVLGSSKSSISCQVLNNGILTKSKGLNFPDSFVDYGDMSENDKFWIKFAMKNDIDFIGTSFVRSQSDIKKLNRVLGYDSLKEVVGGKIKVIAKIETKEAIKNYKEIISEAYGIMIDRGDLASETRFEIIPRLQKIIIEECNRQGKPVIIATQMLDSMVSNPQPTKAEISDIANSVLDGASCLMLSAETAAGKYPLDAVKTMSKVIREVEGEIVKKNFSPDRNVTFTDCIVNAISEIDKMLRMDAILVITSGGYTARMLASKKLRPRIIAITNKEKVFRQMHILWGITPMKIAADLEDITNREKAAAITEAIKKGFITKTSLIILTGSVFHFKSKRTNMIEMHKVNEFLDFVKSNG